MTQQLAVPLQSTAHLNQHASMHWPWLSHDGFQKLYQIYIYSINYVMWMSLYLSASKGKMNMFQRYKGEISLIRRCPEKMNLLKIVEQYPGPRLDHHPLIPVPNPCPPCPSMPRHLLKRRVPGQLTRVLMIWSWKNNHPGTAAQISQTMDNMDQWEGDTILLRWGMIEALWMVYVDRT